MDFFGAQAQARRDSRLLGWAFTACVGAVVLVLGVLVLSVLRVGFALGRDGDPFEASLAAWVAEHPGTTVLVLLGLLGFIGGASLMRMLQLRAGGGYVARSLGGVRVERDAQDPRRRMLSNVVEEMSIASGVPKPEVYVLEQEDGINAFAAGHTPANAAVAVTRGVLTRLNREELQGVIAHEFSHVLNGDMRLNIRLVGVLFGILVLGIAARKVLEVSRGGRDSKGFAAVLLVALAVMVVGYLGLFFGRLIKAGISRQREYLADASAVQFTRQSRGIAGALKKIGGLPAGAKLKSDNTEEMAHMLFGDGVGFSSLFATHPPLVKRIAALEPGFDQAQLLARALMKAGAGEARTVRAIATGSETGAADEPLATDGADAGIDACDPRFSGARFGDVLHDAFEHVDFQAWAGWRGGAAPPGQEAALREALQRGGYVDRDLDDGVAALLPLVGHGLVTELPEGVRLCELPAEQRRAEMEFHFALQPTAVDALMALLHEHGVLLERNGFGARRTLEGLMTGKIDLTYTAAGRWYVLDYKSNRLPAYDPSALAAAMVHSGYDLQALVYTVALHRWLRFRLGEAYDYARDFGGIRYLFCRGLAGGGGIHAAQPAPELVHALDALFAGGGQ